MIVRGGHMDQRATKRIAKGMAVVIVAGTLLTHEDLANVMAVLRGPFVPGEPPHTHNETPIYPEYLFDGGTVVGSTATATGTPAGFTSWTPQDGPRRS